MLTNVTIVIGAVFAFSLFYILSFGVIPAGAEECAKFSIGVSPAFIRKSALLPGRQYAEEIKIRRGCPDGGYLAAAEINAPEIESWLKLSPGESFGFAAGEYGAVLRISIDVPPDAEAGEYRGSMLITLSPPPAEAETAVSLRTRIGTRLGIELTVGEKEGGVNEPEPDRYAARNYDLYNDLRGRIILRVEDAGKAFYVHPLAKSLYYLGRPADALSVMREQGVGITGRNLEKIPIALDYLAGADADGDALPDAFEDAIGSDKNEADTDNDGVSDSDEFTAPSPLKRMFAEDATDAEFARAQAGRILLQVEDRGEAWYVSPVGNKRYFLGRPADAFNIMRYLGLGISDQNFVSLVGR